MNSNLYCEIHKNYPIFHIDLLEGAEKKLQCVKCISLKKRTMNNLLIPEILSFDDKSFLANWPPLSDEQLRKKIIELNKKNEDLNKYILNFYEELTDQINKILSDKKKEQLINAQNIYELKEQIIEQYQKMASIDKIKSCLVQENQSFQKIEQDLKDLIDSQLRKKEEYTFILSNMMDQYEIISKLDIIQPNMIKQNIFEILKIVNLLPQNNFKFRQGFDILNYDNKNNYSKIVEEEKKIIQSDTNRVKNLLEQLHICNEQLTKKMNSKDWYLDEFLVDQQKFVLTTQINQADFLRDVNQNAFQLKSLMTQHVEKLGQTNFKYFDEFIYSLLLKDDNIKFSSLRNSSNYLSVHLNSLFKYQIERVKNGSGFVSCYFNYALKQNKKYIFRIKMYFTNQQSKFYVGLISTQYLNTYQLSQSGIGFLLDSTNNGIFSQNTSQRVASNLFQAPRQQIQQPRSLFQASEQEQSLFTNIFSGFQQQQQAQSQAQSLFSNGFTNQISNNQSFPFQAQAVQSDNAQSYVSIADLEFRICQEDQLIQYSDYPNKSKVNQQKNQIVINQQYHFGFEFQGDYIRDKIEILEFQELDEFPNQ
ncbi:hypothetical protein ABPG74_006601 [Tetrahymena malaccensis]